MSDLIETWKNDFRAFVNSLNLSRDDYKTMMEYIDEIPSVQPELTDEQSIAHLQSSGWMQRHDKEIYKSGLKEQLADDSDSYDSLLPSVHPDHVADISKKVEGDCISRQAALDAFGLSEKTRKYGGDHSGYDTRMLYEIQDTLESLPAVQPDHNADVSKKVDMMHEYIYKIVKDCDGVYCYIKQGEMIRCKECEHWKNEHLCESLSRFGSFETKADFYCGYAERKTDE